MFRISWIFLLAATAVAQNSTGHTIMGGSASLKSGIQFTFRCALTGSETSPVGWDESGITPEGNTVHRYMLDRKSGTYFGYDALIQNGTVKGEYLITLSPLHNFRTPPDFKDFLAGLKPLSTPVFPPPQTLHNGETMEFDLMVSADGKVKITDSFAVGMRVEPQAAATTSAPRDFTLDDGPVNFDASEFTFWQQGRKYDSGPLGFTGAGGATLWVALPGQGRYILSLVAHSGFAKNGAVRDNVVSFSDAGLAYEVRFARPVAGSGKAWNLYVLHDVGYVANHVSIGTGRLESLLPAGDLPVLR